MSFTCYRATRNTYLGQLRWELREGDPLEYDASTGMCRLNGREVKLQLVEELIGNKWIVRDDPPAPQTAVLDELWDHFTTAPDGPLVVATVPAKDALARALLPVPSAPPPREATNARGERIPLASEALAVNGVRPKAGKNHVWGAGVSKDAPAWLNNDGRTCKVCGVTERLPGSGGEVIRADRQRGDGSQQHHYIDAHGHQMTTFEELPCPAYLGDVNGSLATAKKHLREVRGRVDDAEEFMGDVAARLVRLEQDNEFLRERLIAAPEPVLTATLLADALEVLMTRHGGLLPEKVLLLLPEVLKPSVEMVEDLVPLEDHEER